MKPIGQRIAKEFGVRASQVQAAIELLGGGSTVPFVACYLKEANGARIRIIPAREATEYERGNQYRAAQED